MNLDLELFKNDSFVAIDFETATSAKNSACAVGIVSVEEGKIIESYYTIIRPPNNEYNYRCIEVHGIQPHETKHAASFSEVFPEIKKRLAGKTVVAHNERFDRTVLKACMKSAKLNYDALNISDEWQCTLKIYRKKGYKPCRLSDCCKALNIELDHHQALSDAKACAELYLRR